MVNWYVYIKPQKQEKVNGNKRFYETKIKSEIYIVLNTVSDAQHKVWKIFVWNN